MNAMLIFYLIVLFFAFALLLIYLFCRFARVYRTLSSGKREFVGYVWKWSRTYIIYDGIPFFFADRIGFIDQNKNIYLKSENSQYNFVETQYGSVTDDGLISDTNNNAMASCDSIGTSSRRTVVTDASGNEIAFAKTGLRKGDDLLIRAAATGALCALNSEKDKALRADVRIGFKDLALPSALIFMLLFVPLALLGYDTSILSFLGSEISYISYMLLAYAFICWTLYFIKKCMTMRNRSMVYFLGLVDRNIGLTAWNIIIIVLSGLLSLASLFICNYTLFPLFLVLFLGFVINLGCFKDEWKVVDPCSSWGPKWGGSRRAGQAPKAHVPGTLEVVYSWVPVLEAKGIAHANEEVVLTFNESDFDPSAGRVRRANPFAEGPVMSHDELKSKAKTVMKGSDGPENDERKALVAIVNSAYQICQRYSLADFELYDLILMFCQYNIEYRDDKECDTIGNVEEYFRFAAETLVDRKGDCDCKSILAYKIFEVLGVNVDLALVKSNSTEYNHVGLVLHKDSTSVVPIPPSYHQYSRGLIYCETTGEAFAPGEVPPGIDIDTIQLIK